MVASVFRIGDRVVMRLLGSTEWSAESCYVVTRVFCVVARVMWLLCSSGLLPESCYAVARGFFLPES